MFLLRINRRFLIRIYNAPLAPVLVEDCLHVLRLIQWLAPVNLEPPYPPPINHIGINRIALMVPEIERAVDILRAQGVPFLSEVAPCCSGTGEDESAIVHAIDPDGVFLELVGGITKREPLPHPTHCPPMEIKMPPLAG